MGRKTCKVKGSKKVKLKRTKVTAQSKMDTHLNSQQSTSLYVGLNEGEYIENSLAFCTKIVGLCSPGDDATSSLQEAFLQFQKKKQAELTVTSSDRLRCDPKRMLRLRAKFMGQCRMYMGVPYKKKYHKPGTPEYNSKLFLDCCGLVRRVMRDLGKDFGFRIGPWNQAYMFDTLPVAVEEEALMQPGDLVFITAQYYNTKMRCQLHDVVHVEVWLGDGTKTIGARWHKGKVQIFDSYRFESTTYHSMRYHFRSIDTWLQGTCRSFCSLHTWKRRGTFRPTKKSVFYHRQPGVTEAAERNGDEQSDAEDASDEEPCASATPIHENDSFNQPHGDAVAIPTHHTTLPDQRNELENNITEQPIKFVSFTASALLHDTNVSNSGLTNSLKTTEKDSNTVDLDSKNVEQHMNASKMNARNISKQQGSVAAFVSLQAAMQNNSDRVADRVAHGALARALEELKLESKFC